VGETPESFPSGDGSAKGSRFWCRSQLNERRKQSSFFEMGRKKSSLSSPSYSLGKRDLARATLGEKLILTAPGEKREKEGGLLFLLISGGWSRTGAGTDESVLGMLA